MSSFGAYARFLPLVLISLALAPAQSKKPAEPDDITPSIKVDVDLVNVLVSVRNKAGGLVGNLSKDDFTLIEDGKPQTIKYFTAESNLPLTLGIMIDSSGSQRNVIDMEKQVGGAFLKQILTDKDEAYVISFDISATALAAAAAVVLEDEGPGSPVRRRQRQRAVGVPPASGRGTRRALSSDGP